MDPHPQGAGEDLHLPPHALLRAGAALSHGAGRLRERSPLRRTGRSAVRQGVDALDRGRAPVTHGGHVMRRVLIAAGLLVSVVLAPARAFSAWGLGANLGLT